MSQSTPNNENASDGRKTRSKEMNAESNGSGFTVWADDGTWIIDGSLIIANGYVTINQHLFDESINERGQTVLTLKPVAKEKEIEVGGKMYSESTLKNALREYVG